MAQDHLIHFLQPCRYVEANPLRAGLVKRAEDWPWSGTQARRGRAKPLTLADWPAGRPRNWTAVVNDDLPEERPGALRICVNRGRPWGELEWVYRIAKRLSLESRRRNPGRPRKRSEYMQIDH